MNLCRDLLLGQRLCCLDASHEVNFQTSCWNALKTSSLTTEFYNSLLKTTQVFEADATCVAGQDGHSLPSPSPISSRCAWGASKGLRCPSYLLVHVLVFILVAYHVIMSVSMQAVLRTRAMYNVGHYCTCTMYQPVPAWTTKLRRQVPAWYCPMCEWLQG